MPHATSLALVFAGLLGVAAAPAAAQSSDRVLQLQFDADGFVSLRAQHVTSREILAEWARLCGCHLVNADGLRGDPVGIPLLFERQPQAVVLRSLLSQAAGYVLTPRRTGATGPSEFETIYIVPTSTPTSPAYVAGPLPMAPSVVPISTRGAPDNEIPPVPQAPARPAGAAPASADQQPAQRPAGYPGAGLPSVFVPIVPVPSSPFSPSPTRGGGPGTPAQPGQAPANQPAQQPAQPAQPPGGTVGANP
jgi:hypothetical protein